MDPMRRHPPGAGEPGRPGGFALRARRPADLEAGGRLVLAVHALDGYPVKFPEDPSELLAVPDALGAWVAEDAEGLAGHVVLRPGTSAPVMSLATAATGQPAERLAVVGRLLVAPRARRRGIGRALLAAAVARAHELGRHPVLDVVTKDVAAIALYDREGWRRAGTATVTFRNRGRAHTVEELVYLGPEGG